MMVELRPMPRKPGVLLIAAVATFAVFCFFKRPVVFSQSPAALTGDSVISLRVRFGQDESKPTTWDGRVAVSGGELLNLRNWHPHGDDHVGKDEWKLAAEAGPIF